MNLYEINNQLAAIENELEFYAIENGGEISEELLEKEAEIIASLDDKEEAVALFIKNKQAFLNALKDEKKAIDARIKSCNSLIERNKKYLSDFLLGETLETSKVKVSFRKSVSVNVTDEALIGDGFKTFVETVKIDKMAIKKALKTGVVLGAELIENQNISIK